MLETNYRRITTHAICSPPPLLLYFFNFEDEAREYVGNVTRSTLLRLALQGNTEPNQGNTVGIEGPPTGIDLLFLFRDGSHVDALSKHELYP